MNQEFVEFYGTKLLVVKHEGEPMVSLRHLCEGIGVDLMTQLIKARSNPSLTCRGIPTHDSSNRVQEMICIPLKQLNGFLFSINPNKVKPEIRDQLIKYQQKCFEVLHHHFSQKPASNNFEGILSSALSSLEQRMTSDKIEIMGVCRGLRDDVDELQMALTCLIDDKEHDLIRKELNKTKEHLKIDGRKLAGMIRGMLGISTYKAPMAGKRIINCCKNLRGEGLKVVEEQTGESV